MAVEGAAGDVAGGLNGGHVRVPERRRMPVQGNDVDRVQDNTSLLPSPPSRLPHTTEPGGVRGAIARENGRATLRSLPLVGIGDDVDGQAAHCIFNPLVSVFCPLSGHRSPANANRRSVLSCPAPKKERSQACPPCHRRLSTSTTVRAARTSVTSDRQQGITSS
ncbi:hypothetical protein CCHR01_06016 [Colletotrichum chrysophilum]|uniref:Uncharacterized protein n=1 Tax=Colletotrichum chrysophilum TaxID=1836956 RepID=A0AAD9EK36_9PEZI|nr:hypothetical protein CCHR01_06016 [Colletotrichum chrysophilum]